MATIAQEFMKSLVPEVSSQLAGSLGIKKQTATQIIPEVLPLILGGLKRQMETQGGADRANHILNKYGSASVLDSIGDLFAQKAAEKKPDPKLGGLLGDAGVKASGALAMGAAGIAALIDQNGDGSVLDDVAGFLLKGLSQQGGGGGGLLGGLLDNLTDSDR